VNRRLVFDTNTIVSALLFKQGRLTWLRAFWQTGKHQPLASRATVQELIRVLAYPKFKLNEPQVQALLADYLPYVESVDIPKCMPTLAQCRDNKDQMFIELATVGAADVLITGDADLLAMVKVCSFSILSPADFYAEMHGI